jgi:hypothetical protein
MAATVSGVANAAPASVAASDCPDAYPLSQVTKGLEVTGLTVSHGTEPDQITGTIVGRIEDGIAPGVDMIIARMSGSEITDPKTGDVWRGIWAGMSGSPVYAPDGRLIGAVSYGLSYSPSDYAGITPAAQMYRVRDYQSAAKPARALDVPDRLARRMRADGVTQPQLAAGYHRLPVPRTISGLPTTRMGRVAKRADYSGREGLVSGFGSTTSEDPAAIVAGGNLVASLSYGDITYAGTGTATAVCDGEVLAFGHPFGLLGKSTYSMHGADALYIETDTLFGSFKVANPTAPVGQITQDRLAGILGVEGKTPPATRVTSHVEASNGNERRGSTTITETIYRDDIPYITVIHLLANEDRVFDAYAKGTATLRWTVGMKRSNGTSLRYTRKDTYADASDITFGTIWDVYSDIWRIVSNKYADVRVTNVHLESSLDEAYRALSLGTVQRYVGGHWQTLKPDSTVRAKSGSTLRLRAWLEPKSGSAAVGRWVRLQVPVGNYSARRIGELQVTGGASTRSLGKPTSLTKLLSSMASAPTNASVWGRLKVRTPSGPVLKQGHTAAPTVVGGHTSVTVRILS